MLSELHHRREGDGLMTISHLLKLLRMYLATLRRLSFALAANQIVLSMTFFAGFLLVLGPELAQRLQNPPGRVQSTGSTGQ